MNLIQSKILELKIKSTRQLDPNKESPPKADDLIQIDVSEDESISISRNLSKRAPKAKSVVQFSNRLFSDFFSVEEVVYNKNNPGRESNSTLEQFSESIENQLK